MRDVQLWQANASSDCVLEPVIRFHLILRILTDFPYRRTSFKQQFYWLFCMVKYNNSMCVQFSCQFFMDIWKTDPDL